MDKKYELYGQNKDKVFIDHIVYAHDESKCFVVIREMVFHSSKDLLKWLKENKDKIKIIQTRYEKTEAEENELEFLDEKETISVKAFIECLKK